MEKRYIYRVSGYYDMNIGSEEEVIQEIYATEKLAQQRVKQLIEAYKGNGEEYLKSQANEWEEQTDSLFAYADSQWNVNISYKREEVLTDIPKEAPHIDF